MKEKRKESIIMPAKKKHCLLYTSGTMGKEEAMAAMRIEQRESENDRKGGNQEWV